MFDQVNKFNVNQTKIDDFVHEIFDRLIGASTLHHKGEGHSKWQYMLNVNNPQKNC